MPGRSVLNNFYKKLWADAFWPITYFSWIYIHWAGSSVIYGIIFSSLAIAVHLASWIFIYGRSMMAVANEAQTDLAVVLAYQTVTTNVLGIPLLVIIWMIRGLRRVHRVISSIATVDEKLLEFGQCPSKISTLMKLIPLICLPVALLAGIVLHDIQKFAILDNVQSTVIGMVYSRSHNLVILYVQGFFACLVLILGDRYKAVNLVLKKISQEYGYDLRNTRQLTLDRIIAIRELRTIHRQLYFAAKKISKAFGLQLLIITIVSLSTVIGDLYNYYLLNAFSCDLLPSYRNEYLFWCLMHVGPLCMTASCCSWTSAQEKYAAVLLHEMSVSDDTLRMEISTFSLQMIHYDLRFSACGFYYIDLSFIQIIAGTIATYLVILIQIGTAPRECRKSTLIS